MSERRLEERIQVYALGDRLWNAEVQYRWVDDHGLTALRSDGLWRSGDIVQGSTREEAVRRADKQLERSRQAAERRRRSEELKAATLEIFPR